MAEGVWTTGGRLVNRTRTDGSKYMIWVYGEFVAAPKWQLNDVRATMADAVYANWEATAVASDYVPVDGTATETVVPLWQRPDGSMTDLAVAGQPASALAFQVSGEVVLS